MKIDAYSHFIVLHILKSTKRYIIFNRKKDKFDYYQLNKNIIQTLNANVIQNILKLIFFYIE